MVNIHCYTPKSLIWNVTHKSFDHVFVSKKNDNAEESIVLPLQKVIDALCSESISFTCIT